MNKRVIIIFLICIYGITVFAQTAKKDTIQRDLILEREYKPEVDSKEKIIVLPEPEGFTLEKRNSDFYLTGKPSNVKGEYLPLPAPGVKSEFPSQNKLGFLRIGAGSKLAFIGDGQLNFLRSKKHSLDLRLMHNSVFGEMTNSMGVKDRAMMNKNRLMVNYKLNLPEHELKVSLSEKYNSWNYYGTWKTPIMLPDTTISYPELANTQWSSDLKYSLGFSSRKAQSIFNWNLGLEGHFFRLGRGIQHATMPADANKGGKEKEILAFGDIRLDLSDKFHLGVKGNIRRFSYRKPVSYYLNEDYINNPLNYANSFASQSLVELNPFVGFNVKKWDITAGLNISVPSFEDERVKYNLKASAVAPIGDRLLLKADLDGGVVTTSYREGFELNPYLDPHVRINSYYKPLDLKVGVEYRPLKSLRLNAFGGYERSNDKPFFYNGLPFEDFINRAYGSIFGVMYMNSNKFSGGANILYNVKDKLSLSGEVKYNHYANFSKDDAIDLMLKGVSRKAWYSPGLEMRYRLDFSPVDFITVFADYQLSALRYSADTNSFASKMNNIHDLSVGASWNINKDVTLFVQVNNVLDQRFELWNSYKAHGMSAVIGGSVSF